MPWNDASKPPRKPGPWETPVEGGRNDDGVGNKPRRSRVEPPWGREAPSAKPRDVRPSARRDEKALAPPPRGPHLDELSRQLRLRLASAALRPSDRRVRISVVAGGAGLIAVLWAMSGLYVVDTDQSAVVSRFGRSVGEVGAGLHYHLPFPIESVRRLQTGEVHRLDLGADGGQGEAGQMLTRDGDLVDPAYTVEWRIADVRGYLSGLADPEATLRTLAGGALRETIGQLALAQVLAPGHGQAGERARGLLQASLERERAGVTVVGLEIRDVAPPEAAQAGFRDMSAAQADADVQARDAQAYRNRVLAQARADAAKLVQTSQGYLDQEVSEAKGEAARFTLMDAQYRKAPEATRDRLYTETMERVLHNTNKVILPPSSPGAAPVVLPPELFHPRSSDAAPAAQAAPSASASTSAAGPSA